MTISDLEAAEILIAMSRSKPRVIVKPMEKENTPSFPVPRQKRSSFRVPRIIGRSFPTDPSSSSSAALMDYVSLEDYPNGHIHHSPSPRIPLLSRKQRYMASSSTALVGYVSQEDASPPTMPHLSRNKRPMDPSSSTALVEYASQEDASPPTMPPLKRKKRPPIAKQPKNKAKVAASEWMSEPTPEWLLNLVKGGEEPKRIIEKRLSATDVSRSHNRLSMPFSKILDLDFLSLEEQGIIQVDEKKPYKTGINAKLVVKFVDSDVPKEFEVNFRRWKMPKKSGSPTFLYNLVTGWNNVVDFCGLGESDRIRVWSYHSEEGKLCFALDLATPAPPHHPLLLLPPPPLSDDSGNSTPEEMSSALVIYDKSDDDLQPN